MVVVDSHCHASQDWYEPIETLLFEMDRYGVDQAVLIQIIGQCDNSYQSECVQRYPGRLASVVLVDWHRPAAPGLAARLADAGASGVRLNPSRGARAMGVRCGAARTISAASQPATSHASLARPPDPCSRFAANSRRRGDMSRHGFRAWAGAAIAARPRMTGVVAWIAGAMLLVASIGPALAQTTTSPDEAGAADQAAPPQPRSDFPYGVLLADIGSAPRAAEAGFRVMASTVSWRRTEPNRGQYPFEQTDQWGQTAPNDVTNLITAARSNGMKFGFRLIDPPDWAGGSPAHVAPADLEDYVYHVVRYSHDSLAYFELFNEQNLAFEWGGAPDPAGYARLMAAAYRGAKRADPSIPVISAGPSQRTGGRGGSMEDVDWLDGFLQAGGGESIDALGVHAYLGSFEPGADPSCTPLCFRQVEEFRGVMQRHGAGQSMYVTEFGALEDTPMDLGQFTWMKLPPDVRASDLVDAFRRANADYPWIGGATLFNLDYAAVGSIPPTSEQFWFSLLKRSTDDTIVPTSAYTAIQEARRNEYLP